MATVTTQASHPIDDEYKEMEIISSASFSSSNFFTHPSISSPTHSSSTTKEFEFQMSSVPNQDKETSTFPADELFYKGKLLPLHLPPRLQMVQNILQTSNTTNIIQEEEEGFEEQQEEETFTIPFNMINRRSVSITAPCTNTTNTPLESCNISPSESCRVSCELNPDEYLSQWSSSSNHHEVMRVFNFIGGGGSSSSSKKYHSSWSTKLMKQFSLGRKLKASRAYLKSLLFNKSSSCDNNAEESDHQYHDQVNVNADSKKNPFGKMQISTTFMKRIENEIANSHHRKSFSGVTQRHISSSSSSSSFGATSTKSSSLSSITSISSSGSSSSSSSFSLSSNGCCYDHLQLLKRSSSASSELEGSIEGAIAYCKQSASQQFFSSRKSTTNNYQDGVFSLSNSASSRIAA